MAQEQILIKTIRRLIEILTTGLSTNTIPSFIKFFRIPCMQIFISDLTDREHCAGRKMAALELLPRVNIYKPANLALIFIEWVQTRNLKPVFFLWRKIFTVEKLASISKYKMRGMHSVLLHYMVIPPQK